MENTKKYGGTSTTIQFTKLHEKVQKKYEEMQRKLNKSKSIDLLCSEKSDLFNKYDRKYASVYEIDKVDQKFNNDYINSEMKSSNMCFQNNKLNIIKKEMVKTKSKSLSSLDEKYESEQDNIKNNLCSNNTLNTSMESLQSDDSNVSLSPSTKSLRDRISSRIIAAKKRRREKKTKSLNNGKELSDEVDKFILSNSTKYDYMRFEKKIKLATVTIALIEISGFEEDTEEKQRALMCRLRLGTEKYKLKLIKTNLSVVKVQEIINFDQYEDEHLLELVIWDKEVLIGRTTIDLSTLNTEKTYKFRKKLEGDTSNIKVFLLLTISGILKTNTLYEVDEKKYESIIISSKQKYAWYRLGGQFSYVGCLWIIVYGAKGLSGNDCYCVLNLNNERLRTATDYKTNMPSWMKIFSFTVTDITSSLDVMIIDEKKSEEVGRIMIPLLGIESGKNKWYALKDATLLQRAKGNNPRVLLEINISWNFIKAATRVINVKESNYLQSDEKLDRHIFARNLSRAKAVTSWILNFLKIFKSCFQWDSWKINLTAIVVWILFCSFGKIWMLPLLLLTPFIVYNYKKIKVLNCGIDLIKNEMSDNDIESGSDKDEKSISLRQRIQSWQEMILVVQNSIGKFASIGESIKNLYNFSAPFVSSIAIFFILVIAFFMYIIPLNYICICWGIHKYTQKIFRPNRNPHNEILDLISRVPDDETLEKQKELPLEKLSDDED